MSCAINQNHAAYLAQYNHHLRLKIGAFAVCSLAAPFSVNPISMWGRVVLSVISLAIVSFCMLASLYYSNKERMLHVLPQVGMDTEKLAEEAVLVNSTMSKAIARNVILDYLH